MNKRLKSDKYKKARGGDSHLLEIFCQQCGETICQYQKDGAGNLRRMYFDRIIDPNVSVLKKDLSCSSGHLLGVKIIYKKEKRLAFRLLSGAVKKKLKN